MKALRVVVLLIGLVSLVEVGLAHAQSCVTTGSGTALANAAANMTADSWCSFATNGIGPATWLDVNAVEKNINTDAARGCYDSVTGAIHYLANGHSVPTLSPVHHVSYNPATNTWIALPTPPWGGTGKAAPVHGWNYIACDVRGGILYRGDLSTSAIHRYNMRTQTWLSDITIPNSVMSNLISFYGMTWFPDRGTAGRLFFTSLESCSGPGTVAAEYDPATGTFARVQAALLTGLSSCSGTSYAYAEYSPLAKTVLFGSDTTAIRLLNAQGTIASGANAPRESNENRACITHAIPANGNFVMICSGVLGVKEWHIYNPFTNVWTQKVNPTDIPGHILNYPDPDPSLGPVTNTIGVPIWDLGVTMYVKCGATACGVSLYKGSTANQLQPMAPTGLRLTP